MELPYDITGASARVLCRVPHSHGPPSWRRRRRSRRSSYRPLASGTWRATGRSVAERSPHQPLTIGLPKHSGSRAMLTAPGRRARARGSGVMVLPLLNT
jgi:hypothetical protein